MTRSEQILLDSLTLGDLRLEFRICFGEFDRSFLNPEFQFIVGLLHFRLGMFEISDIKCNAMNEPGPTLLGTDHLDVTMKPNGVSVPRDNPIHGSQGFAREHHLGSL